MVDSTKQDGKVNQLTRSKSQQRRIEAQTRDTIKALCKHVNREPSRYESEWYCHDCGISWFEET